MCCTEFAGMLFNFFFKGRSREINGGEATDDAAANDETARGASSTHTSTEAQGMATSSGYDYEVFLSFRGPDTRSGFTDFLYTCLDSAGIRTFKDDEELRVGEEFAPELVRAIDQSKISIPIFSKGYASSVWCLKEVAQMIECQKSGRQKIMPIFYDVAPSDIRYHQTGVYREAFLSHEKKGRYDKDTIRQWKAALNAVGAINGWDLQSEKNRREGEFAKTVTQEVFNYLKKAYLEVSDCLVSVDHHVDEIMQMIDAQTSETRIIGIHGMGGVGKSTIARIIYNQLSNNFKDCCFLSNIREMSERKGIESLQHQLISGILKSKFEDIKNIDEGTQAIKDRLSTKAVLILLDDVDHKKQIDALLGKRNWFGRGSKLIITTRNKEVLKVPQVDDCYEVNCMDSIQSLQLFSKHAFRRDSPLDEYTDQSTKAIGIAGGLPLALEVIGSLLSGTEKEKWGETLDELAKYPHRDVESKLKISYGALRDREKRIFLDIACLFVGFDKDVVIHFWDESTFSPKGAMKVLENKSLIKISKYNIVWMHDLLKDLGRAIVREKSDMKIEKQSRIWDLKEGLDLLRRHKGNKEVEALHLPLDHGQQYCFTYEGFESLSSLRFLEVHGSKENFHAEKRLLWHEPPSDVLPSNDNSCLLPELRWLSWRDVPPTFNITKFSMENVAVLSLFESEITHYWKGWSHLKVMENLKVLHLSGCQSLKRTPIFSAQTNLEHLILSFCGSLIEIDGSICQLKRLVSLDLSYCKNLQRLPDELGGALARLEYLYLRWCKSLERLPDTIGNLVSLIKLDISNTRIKELPDSIGELKALKVVKVVFGDINKISDVFWTNGKLEQIEILHVNALHVKIGNCIHMNQSLRILKLECGGIYALPKLPETLIELQLKILYTDRFPDLSNLTNLKELRVFFGSRDSDGKSYGLLEDPIPQWIGHFSKLESLNLTFCRETTSPTALSLPPQLKSLSLRGSNLRRLPTLPSSLSSLHLDGCRSLCSMEDLSNLKKLSSLEISSTAITEIPGLGCLENLRELRLCFLEQVEILPDLSNLNKLRNLRVVSLNNLVEIQGLACLENLQDLQLDFLRQLKRLPDLSNLNKLRNLRVDFSYNLVEIQGDLPQSFEELQIRSCESLQKLPVWSSLKGLRLVEINYCRKLPSVKIGNCIHMNQSLRILKLECGGIYALPKLPETLIELQLGKLYTDRFPDLSNLTNLKELRVVFGSCDSDGKSYGLLEDPIPQWIGNFSKLESLNLALECETTSPTALSLPPQLKSLSLWGSNLSRLPTLPSSLSSLHLDRCQSLCSMEDLSNLKKLSSLEISSTAITEIPGLGCLENLQDLKLHSLKYVEILPDLSNLNKLRNLRVKFSDNLVEIQGDLPQSFEELQIFFCESLQKLPDWSSLKGLRLVEIIDCRKLPSVKIGNCIHMNQSLRILKLECGGIYALPKLPETLIELQLGKLYTDRFPDLSNLTNLKELRVVFGSCDSDGKSYGLLEDPIPQWIGNFSKLESLNLAFECETTSPIALSLPPQLKSLLLRGSNLRRLPTLPSSLSSLHLDRCGSLCSMEDLSNLKKLSSLQISSTAITEIPGLGCLENLRELRLGFLKQVEILPDLSNLNKLTHLVVGSCANLVEIQGLACLENLQDLQLHWLQNVEILPDLSNLNKLRNLRVDFSDNLVEIQGDLPQSLKKLQIRCCKSLQKLPDWSSLKGLRLVEIDCEKYPSVKIGGEHDESESESEAEDYE